MPLPAIRAAAPVRRIYHRMLYRRSLPLPAGELSHSALVFSPHFDDETLGCGGMIIKKRQAGAPVKIVFMTDGSQSHSQWMETGQLSSRRACEAELAAQAMDVGVGQLEMLSFPETQLMANYQPALERVRGLLRANMPRQVFLPYAGEPPLWSLDHQATTRIVLEALRFEEMQVEVYEYPIWFWYHWPWVEFPRKPGRATAHILQNSLAAKFGLRLLHDFRSTLDVSDVLSQKMNALSQHRSQMQRLGGENWPILSDIASGAFLSCFFTGVEIFHQYRFGARELA